MHQILPRSSGNVIGIKISGKLSHKEYKKIVPYIEKNIKHFKKVRLLIELSKFEGWDFHAAIDDLMFIFRHGNEIEQLALVVDKKGDQWSVLLDQPFGRMVGGRQRVFKSSELDEAWDWTERGKTTLLNIDSKQYRKEAEIRYGSDMRILIVGGGITALTLGALLKQRGFSPMIIGKKKRDIDTSYVVTVWPLGSRVLKGLGLYPQLKKQAMLFKELCIADASGKNVRSYKTKLIRDKNGSTYTLKRTELIDLLKECFSEDELKPNALIESIEQTNKGVEVSFKGGEKEIFDIVVGCDGLKSSLRKQVLGKEQTSSEIMHRWNFAADPSFVEQGTVLEYWEENKMVGLYPAKNHASIVMAMSGSGVVDSKDPHKFLKKSFKNFKGKVPEVLSTINSETQIWCNNFKDVRLSDWHKGRVVFIGDAAFSTLPMTGIGISMAMESASVLAEELTRSDSCYVCNSLEQFVARRQLRVGHIQKLSYLYDQIREPGQGWFGKIKSKAFQFFSKDDFVQFWNEIHSEHI